MVPDRHPRRSLGLLPLLLVAAVPARAQQADLTGRVDRIEKELHAVQRKVFPGGDPGYVEPQITAPAAASAESGTPAGSALGDLVQRIAALEAQVRTLTNQSEVDAHRLDQLEQASTKAKADTDYRLDQLEHRSATATAAPAPGATDDGSAPAPFGPAGRKAPDGRRGQAAAGADAATMAAQASPDQGPPAAAAPVRAGDPAEAAYMAGFDLWSQKRYPEAEAALKDVVAKYPTSKRASFAQNLLGRAYMDDGQLSAAADAFLTSYKKFPRGERAPDSLYYLGVTLTRLKKQGQACQVYDELRDVYGATLNATLKTRVTQGRTDAGCGA